MQRLLQCNGSFDISLYSIEGSVHGRVTIGGDPVHATVVAAAADLVPDAQCGGFPSETTDADGNYTFTSPTAGGNNWGLQLLGDGSAAGERTYYVRACHALAQPCSQVVPSRATSSSREFRPSRNQPVATHRPASSPTGPRRAVATR